MPWLLPGDTPSPAPPHPLSDKTRPAAPIKEGLGRPSPHSSFWTSALDSDLSSCWVGGHQPFAISLNLTFSVWEMGLQMST